MPQGQQEQTGMSKEAFTIFYGPRGESAEAVPIDSRALGASLLALGDLLTEANAFLNKNNGAQLRVNVTGFKNGCFGVDLETVVSLLQRTYNLLWGQKVQGAIAILAFMGFQPISSAKGVWQYLRAAKGQRPKKVEQLPTADGRAKAKATFPDGTVFEGDYSVIEYASKDGTHLRINASNVLSPLRTCS